MGRSIGIVLGALIASPGTGSGLCKIRFWIGQSERETDGVDRYGAIIDVDATR